MRADPNPAKANDQTHRRCHKREQTQNSQVLVNQLFNFIS